ncbi:MAG TPA: RsmE family RNA methyltransferase [Polyangiaceae bacterium]
MIRAPVPGLSPGERRLEGALAHYLVRVLRLRAGDAFVAFDPASAEESDATTVWADDDAITVRFGPLRPGAARAAREVTWIQGLAKGDKVDAVVRDATELGATRFVVAVTRRSVVKLDATRAAERQARWARIAQEAARQCGRADTPRVESPCAWSDALTLAADASSRFVLWERATDPLGPALLASLSSTGALAFACGPEGGLEDREVDEARAAGWTIASLGPLALRTETVAAAVLGAVRVWTG